MRFSFICALNSGLKLSLRDKIHLRSEIRPQGLVSAISKRGKVCFQFLNKGFMEGGPVHGNLSAS